MQSPKQKLLNDLRGQHLEIPNLQHLFRDWPQYVNPELGKLRHVVNELLERSVKNFTVKA